MKMAKASEADLRMAMDLCSALDLLGQRFIPCMPEAIEQLGPDDEREPFDSDDDAQCGRAMRHLLEIAERGSLMRVVWGMAVLLDPANRMVDSDADTLERHPSHAAAVAALKNLVDRDFTFFSGAMVGANKKITRDEVLAARDALSQVGAP
jgi:hypothetical protein